MNKKHIQDFDVTRELLKLYNTPNSLKSQQDLDLACYFNLFEFAEYHDIDGEKILGVFTSDVRAMRNANQDFDLINKAHGILFLKCEDVSNVNVEQPLRLDGKLYQVEEAVKLGNVIWRLKLTGNIS